MIPYLALIRKVKLDGVRGVIGEILNGLVHRLKIKINGICGANRALLNRSCKRGQGRWGLCVREGVA